MDNFFLFFGIGAVIGFFYALIRYGIPMFFMITKLFLSLFAYLFKECIEGFIEGWQQHSSEPQK